MIIKNRKGEKGVNSQGLEMQIVAYRKSYDIDVKFIKSGYIVHNNTYVNFQKGSITDQLNPKGVLYETRENMFGCEMKIIKCNSSSNVDIQFTNSGYIVKGLHYSAFKEGTVIDRSTSNTKISKFIYDIEKVKNDESVQLARKYWNSMKNRVFNNKYNLYDNVKICSDWYIFSNYYKWFMKNFRFDLYLKGLKLEMDKDLLSDKCDKKYSPKTAIFIPQVVNMYIVKRPRNQLGFTGVTIDKNSKTNPYRATIVMFGEKKKTQLGNFSTPEQAHKAYVKAKRQGLEQIREQMLSGGYSKELVDKINFYTIKGGNNE